MLRKRQVEENWPTIGKGASLDPNTLMAANHDPDANKGKESLEKTVESSEPTIVNRALIEFQTILIAEELAQPGKQSFQNFWRIEDTVKVASENESVFTYCSRFFRTCCTGSF